MFTYGTQGFGLPNEPMAKCKENSNPLYNIVLRTTNIVQLASFLLNDLIYHEKDDSNTKQL